MARYPNPRKWIPKNPDKYEGDYTNVVARSSLEIRFLNWCDNNPAVLSYSSEEVIIPYRCATDNRIHRYFIDAKIKVKTKDGIKVYLIEIKPESQTRPPISKRKTKRYLEESMVYIKNQSKWKYAIQYCLDRGWEFKIITDKDLGL